MFDSFVNCNVVEADLYQLYRLYRLYHLYHPMFNKKMFL